MWIRNSTNLKEQYIRTIAELVKPISTPEITSIDLRNKQEGFTHGNWGRFYSHDYSITLCVPQFISNYQSLRTVTKKDCFYEDRYDFLAAVLGHEYRHAWQWTNKRDLFDLKQWIEVDAEEYEPIALQLWLDYKSKNDIQITPESQAQAATKQLKWSDYKARDNK